MRWGIQRWSPSGYETLVLCWTKVLCDVLYLEDMSRGLETDDNTTRGSLGERTRCEDAASSLVRQEAVLAGAMPIFSARRTSSATEATSIFSIIRPRCTMTVFSAMPSAKAICLLSRPAMCALSDSLDTPGQSQMLPQYTRLNAASGPAPCAPRDHRRQQPRFPESLAYCTSPRLRSRHLQRRVSLPVRASMCNPYGAGKTGTPRSIR